MELKRVWAMYFSPTGGTEKAVKTTAQALAAKLGLPLESYDFTLPQGREKDAVFGEGDLVVCGTPVIAGRVPNVLLPYLTEQVKGNGAYAVPVVSFGNRNYDDALIELRNILEQDGFQTVAGGAFVSEHSFSKTLAAGFGKHAGIWRKNRGKADKRLGIYGSCVCEGVRPHSSLFQATGQTWCAY